MQKSFSDLIERFFIKGILEALDEKGLNYTEFALRVWPDAPKKTALGRFRLMRNAADGKYQHITLTSASRMAEALGMDLSYLLAVAKADALRTLKAGDEKLPTSDNGDTQKQSA
jgi:hypothetical protein